MDKATARDLVIIKAVTENLYRKAENELPKHRQEHGRITDYENANMALLNAMLPVQEQADSGEHSDRAMFYVLADVAMTAIYLINDLGLSPGSKD